MRIARRHGWQRLIALILSLTIVAAQAVAAPGPLAFAPSVLLDPGAICHADGFGAPDEAPGQAHDCCQSCHAPPLHRVVAGPVAAASAGTCLIHVPPTRTAPNASLNLPAYDPRGPPPAQA